MQLAVAHTSREVFGDEFACETDVHGHLACFGALGSLQRAVGCYGHGNGEVQRAGHLADSSHFAIDDPLVGGGQREGECLVGQGRERLVVHSDVRQFAVVGRRAVSRFDDNAYCHYEDGEKCSGAHSVRLLECAVQR